MCNRCKSPVEKYWIQIFIQVSGVRRRRFSISIYSDRVTNTSVLEYFSFIKKKKSNKIQL